MQNRVRWRCVSTTPRARPLRSDLPRRFVLARPSAVVGVDRAPHAAQRIRRGLGDPDRGLQQRGGHAVAAPRDRLASVPLERSVREQHARPRVLRVRELVRSTVHEGPVLVRLVPSPARPQGPAGRWVQHRIQAEEHGRGTREETVRELQRLDGEMPEAAQDAATTPRVSTRLETPRSPERRYSSSGFRRRSATPPPTFRKLRTGGMPERQAAGPRSA